MTPYSCIPLMKFTVTSVLTSRACACVSNVVLLGVMCAFAVVAPYQKVEENFGTNAVYDILNAVPFSDRHHVVYADWVQRSPLFAYLVAAMVSVTQLIAPWVNPLINVRLCMGLLTYLCFCFFTNKLSKRFGLLTGNLFVILVSVQFHLPYYASRMLVNTSGLCIALIGMGLWINSQPLRAIAVLVFASFTVRLDVFVVAMGIGIDYLLVPSPDFRTVLTRLARGCAAGLIGLVAAGIVAVPVDSFFWTNLARPVWAELTVVWFNVVENKSHLWGVLPWHWYFTNALPRCLGPPIIVLLRPAGRESYRLLFAAVFVPLAILSLLGHKEARFAFPSIAAVTAVAAINLAPFLRTGRKMYVLPSILMLGVTFGLSLLRLIASSCNYPGGETLVALTAFATSTTPSLPAVVLPFIANYIPRRFVHLTAHPSVNTTEVVAFPKSSCSVFAGYSAMISGHSKFVSHGVPCQVVSDEDASREGSRVYSVADKQMFDFWIAEPNDSSHPVSVTYAFDRIDLEGMRIVLSPALVVCTKDSIL